MTQSPQSTGHIMMIEPLNFHANPQTRETNSYQHEDDKGLAAIQDKAVEEFRAFRDLLVTHGVVITTTLGQAGCPDDIFCNNWVSTHHGGRMVLYPMLAPNRQRERRKDLIEILRRTYKDVQDFTLHEQHGKYLESTGAMCMDRVNKIAYQARSGRSYEELAAMWCKMNGYTHIPFDTLHRGKPVYHADVVMWIGTTLAGICSECLTSKDIVKHLMHKREVIEFTNAQMEKFCGNSLEVIGTGGERMLVMSKAGYDSLMPEQVALLRKHYKYIITPSIPTIEYYGGGSARCMLLELY